MPALPIIDSLIFLGWSSLMVAFILKAIDMTTHYRPSIFGLTAQDFLWASAISLLFALTLAARTWVKMNEPRILRERWRRFQAPEAFPGWNGEPARSGEEARPGPSPALEDPAPAAIRTPASTL